MRRSSQTQVPMNQPAIPNNVIPDVALVDNTEQRTPLVLVLDCSGSMQGAAIDQLNEGMRLLEKELKDDAIASKRVRLLVIKYGGHDTAEVIGDWQDAMDFAPTTLEATGTTPTGQAVDLALAKVEEEKAAFRHAGVAYTRPWLFLMSDGQPTDDWQDAADRCRQAEAANKVAVFPIFCADPNAPQGVIDQGVDSLGAFSGRGAAAVKRLNGLKFRELFLWLSASMKVVSQSRPGQQAQLPPVDTWSNAPT
jgi:uncharacterized protein YegL